MGTVGAGYSSPVAWAGYMCDTSYRFEFFDIRGSKYLSRSSSVRRGCSAVGASKITINNKLRAGNLKITMLSRGAEVDAVRLDIKGPPFGGGDVNLDRRVDIVDLSILLSKWGSGATDADRSGNGRVDIVDLSILLSDWGPVGSTFSTAATQTDPGHQAESVRQRGSEAIGRLSEGAILGNAVAANGETQPVEWVATPTGTGKPILVPGASDAAATAISRDGHVVGSALAGDDQVAWNRDPAGRVSLLRADYPASAAAVSSVREVAGFQKRGDRAEPVVWTEAASDARALETPVGSPSGSAVTISSAGVLGNVGERVALWDRHGKLVASWSGEAVGINPSGWTLFNRPSSGAEKSIPALRSPDGKVTDLKRLPWAMDSIVATSVDESRYVTGAVGQVPAVWAPGRSPRLLELPSGSNQGQVVGYDRTRGEAFGWVASNGGEPRAHTWSGVTPAAIQAGTSAPVWTKPRPVVTASAVKKRSRLKVDVNPSLEGQKAWKAKVQKKVKGRFKTVRSVRTKRTAEVVTLNVRRGTYRAVIPAQHGYAKKVSNKAFVRR